MVAKRQGFFLQISSFKGLYANYNELHKPNLKALRLFGNKVALCDTDSDIRMKPLGRACSGNGTMKLSASTDSLRVSIHH